MRKEGLRCRSDSSFQGRRWRVSGDLGHVRNHPVQNPRLSLARVNCNHQPLTSKGRIYETQRIYSTRFSTETFPQSWSRPRTHYTASNHRINRRQMISTAHSWYQSASQIPTATLQWRHSSLIRFKAKSKASFRYDKAPSRFNQHQGQRQGSEVELQDGCKAPNTIVIS